MIQTTLSDPDRARQGCRPQSSVLGRSRECVILLRLGNLDEIMHSRRYSRDIWFQCGFSEFLRITVCILRDRKKTFQVPTRPTHPVLQCIPYNKNTSFVGLRTMGDDRWCMCEKYCGGKMVSKSTWYNHNLERRRRPRGYRHVASTSTWTPGDPFPDPPPDPGSDIDVKEPPLDAKPAARSPDPVSIIR